MNDSHGRASRERSITPPTTPTYLPNNFGSARNFMDLAIKPDESPSPSSDEYSAVPVNCRRLPARPGQEPRQPDASGHILGLSPDRLRRFAPDARRPLHCGLSSGFLQPGNASATGLSRAAALVSPEMLPAVAPAAAPAGDTSAVNVAGQMVEAKSLADVLAGHFCQPGQLVFKTLRSLHGSDREVANEVALTLAALRGLGALKDHLGDSVGTVGATLPGHMCFYWLVVWGLLPAAQAKEVLLWVPLAVHDRFRVLMKALQCAAHWPTAGDPLRSFEIPSRDAGLFSAGAQLRLLGEPARPAGARGRSKEVLSVDLRYFGSVCWAPDALLPPDCSQTTSLFREPRLLFAPEVYPGDRSALQRYTV